MSAFFKPAWRRAARMDRSGLGRYWIASSPIVRANAKTYQTEWKKHQASPKKHPANRKKQQNPEKQQAHAKKQQANPKEHRANPEKHPAKRGSPTGSPSSSSVTDMSTSQNTAWRDELAGALQEDARQARKDDKRNAAELDPAWLESWELLDIMEELKEQLKEGTKTFHSRSRRSRRRSKPAELDAWLLQAVRDAGFSADDMREVSWTEGDRPSLRAVCLTMVLSYYSFSALANAPRRFGARNPSCRACVPSSRAARDVAQQRPLRSLTSTGRHS